MKQVVKRVMISVIANDGGKDKHVAIDIDKADEIAKHPGISQDAITLLGLIGGIIESHPDAHKVFINPDSEKDPEKPTYLLKTA